MTFQEYWKTEGARRFCPSHEDRARLAWDARSKQAVTDLIDITVDIKKLNHSGTISSEIAFDDLMVKIAGMLLQ